MSAFHWHRLLAVTLKELVQLRRDRLTHAMIIGIPIMLLLLFGYAINLDVRELPAVVVDQAQTARSRQAIAELGQTQVLDFRYASPDPARAQALIRDGRAEVAVIVPPDFEHRLAGDQPLLQLVVDGADQVIQQAVRQLTLLPLRAVLNGTPAATPTPASTDIAVLPLYNPQRRAPLNTVPGLIGVLLAMTMVMFTAIALVREREQGNLEFLIVTPLSSAELTLGKVLPFVLIGLLQTTLVLLLGHLIFKVPVRGSLLDLYAAALLFVVACLALGIFISTLVKSQFQAMQAAFFSFLPQILLSGFMFPFDGMPRPAQWLAELLPLTHFVRLARAIMLRGVGLAPLWQDLSALLLFTLVMLTVAILRVHKRLD